MALLPMRAAPPLLGCRPRLLPWRATTATARMAVLWSRRHGSSGNKGSGGSCSSSSEGRGGRGRGRGRSGAVKKQRSKVGKGGVVALPDPASDFAGWYAAILREAEVVEHGPVRGTMVLRPYGYAIWERVQAELDARMKANGVQNVSLPSLLPGRPPPSLSKPKHTPTHRERKRERGAPPKHASTGVRP
jgi:hypothetical protein